MKSLILTSPLARQAACAYIMQAPEGFVVKIAEPKRSEEASALMWVLLGHFADQLHWPVNGKLIKLSPEEWKEITTAAFNQEHVRLAAGLNGGVVMLGERTSKFGKKRMSEFIEFLMATGVERGVEFSEMAAA